jgi:hypothetical protein
VPGTAIELGKLRVSKTYTVNISGHARLAMTIFYNPLQRCERIFSTLSHTSPARTEHTRLRLDPADALKSPETQGNYE